MYTHAEYKRGHDDAKARKPMAEDQSLEYRAGWQAAKDFIEILTRAGWVEPDGMWVPARDVPDDGN